MSSSVFSIPGNFAMIIEENDPKTRKSVILQQRFLVQGNTFMIKEDLPVVCRLARNPQGNMCPVFADHPSSDYRVFFKVDEDTENCYLISCSGLNIDTKQREAVFVAKPMPFTRLGSTDVINKSTSLYYKIYVTETDALIPSGQQIIGANPGDMERLFPWYGKNTASDPSQAQKEIGGSKRPRGDDSIADPEEEEVQIVNVSTHEDAGRRIRIKVEPGTALNRRPRTGVVTATEFEAVQKRLEEMEKRTEVAERNSVDAVNTANLARGVTFSLEEDAKARKEEITDLKTKNDSNLALILQNAEHIYIQTQRQNDIIDRIKRLGEQTGRQLGYNAQPQLQLDGAFGSQESYHMYATRGSAANAAPAGEGGPGA